MSDVFICRDCGKEFTLSAAMLAKYRNWKPSQCMPCRSGKGAKATDRTTEAVLAAYSDGPQSGVFTDGGCDPNPGPGGWGAVKVIDGVMTDERHGHEPLTTNNQMELRALIEALRMVGDDETIVVYSDSLYCVKTINVWAAGWQAQGWKRGKAGDEVKNLDLVRELYDLKQARPSATLEWLKGHSGMRWNEYADALAQRWKSQEPALTRNPSDALP